MIVVVVVLVVVVVVVVVFVRVVRSSLGVNLGLPVESVETMLGVRSHCM